MECVNIQLKCDSHPNETRERQFQIFTSFSKSLRTISFNFRLHLVLKYLDCDIFCSGRGVEEEEMKVTVSFNTVKIVVPCGDGEKTVRELTQLATIRSDFLKKASQA